jgi:hypothetical protein
VRPEPGAFLARERARDRRAIEARERAFPALFFRIITAHRCRLRNALLTHPSPRAAGCDYHTNCASCVADTTCGWYDHARIRSRPRVPHDRPPRRARTRVSSVRDAHSPRHFQTRRFWTASSLVGSESLSRRRFSQKTKKKPNRSIRVRDRVARRASRSSFHQKHL